MKKRLVIATILCGLVQLHAALTLKEIRTASNNVLVVFFNGTSISANAVDITDISQWKVNGEAATAISRYVMQANACDYHIYLTVPQLVNGTTYNIGTPYGDTSIVFDDHKIFCESIKTNQAAYSALCKSNYANFAIWLGDGGNRQISGALPAYEVFEVYTNKVVAQGTLAQVGEDKTSGDFVYKIDLSSVPQGGPYKIAIAGYGCSHPFGVGGDFSRRLAHIMFRGQYYQRCGCPIREPYGWNLRQSACHTHVYDVDGPIGEANIVVAGSEPTMTVFGGYHDAGDTDRRAYHIANPVINLMLYEAFPNLFVDDQFNIPDKFDENFNILGKGNGIPDIIDEAEWGTLIWEYLQNEDGSIHFGTETKGYADAAPYDVKDKHLYGTVKIDDRPAAVAPGLFLHLARLLKPYSEARAQQLVERARRTFDYISTKKWAKPEKLYYYIQKYLYDGDEAAHEQVKSLADSGAVKNFPLCVTVTPGYSLNNSAFDNPGYVVSYMVEKTRATDPEVIAKFTSALKEGADSNIVELKKYAYPVGNNPVGTSWGHNARQSSYACAPLLYWRFSGEQTYFDAACNLMNYNLGLNPLGISYVTGLGFHQVHNPHDRQSWYTKSEDWGVPVPGITVFGPGVSPTGTTVPALTALPVERQFADNQNCYSMTEFTIFETMTHYSMYTVLAGGGKWDETNDPYASQQSAIKREREKVRVNPGSLLSANLRNGKLVITLNLMSKERIRGSLFTLNGAVLSEFDLGIAGPGISTFQLPIDKMGKLGMNVVFCRIHSGKSSLAGKVLIRE
ncbi:MAG: hypothetical protein GX556_06335 [Fibrobacter sp.]|nr:hypothetical protein [Fibrobacter sp.]